MGRDVMAMDSQVMVIADTTARGSVVKYSALELARKRAVPEQSSSYEFRARPLRPVD